MTVLKTYKNVMNSFQLGTKQGHVSAYQKPKTTLFQISSIIDKFKDVNQSFLVDDGYKGIIGTSNPYQFNLFSDLITNPSSVSISEFQKMAYTMPVLSAGLTILRLLIISKIGPYNHKNEKYKKFINDMLNNMVRSKEDINEDICTSLWAGFFLGEKRYESDGRYVYIVDIEPRPAQSILYRVDSQGHLKDDGVIQYYFNNLWTGYGNLLAFNGVTPWGQNIPNPYAARGDFDYPWRTVWAQPIGTVIIPRNKCVHFAYKGVDGLTSPYGRSLLRAAYDTYVVNAEMPKITRNAANFKASPVPVVVVDPNQVNTDQGQTAFDQIGEELSALGIQGNGDSFLLLKGKLNDSVWVDKLETNGDLAGIVEINKYFDSKLLLSILLASELMGMADHGANALGKEQHNLLDRIIDSIATRIKKTVWIDQVVKPMLQLNFNEQEDFGSFDTVENMNQDMQVNAQILDALEKQGIKLKPETIMSMFNLNEDAIKSFDNPIIDRNPMMGFPGMPGMRK